MIIRTQATFKLDRKSTISYYIERELKDDEDIEEAGKTDSAIMLEYTKGFSMMGQK